jgi:DNA-binding XRE family transcriptional regulator
MANTEKAQLQAEIKRLQEQIRHLEYGTRSVLGKNVLYHRKRLNLTQLDLAQKAEVTRVTIANIELGTSNTSIPCLMRLCTIFDVTPNDLLLEKR